MLPNLYCFSRNKQYTLSQALFIGRHGGRSWHFLLCHFIAFRRCMSPSQHFFDRLKSRECSFFLRDCFCCVFPQLSANFLRYRARLFSVTWKKELYYSSKPIRLLGFCGGLIPCLIDCWRGSLSMLKGPVRYGRSRWQKDALLDWIARWLFDRFTANRIGDFFKYLKKNKREWHKN